MVGYLTLVPIHEVMARGKRVDSPVDLHRAVMSLFGDLAGSARKDAAILYRIERIPGTAPSLLVRSSVQPEHVPTSALVRELDPRAPAAGTPVAFRIAVNAVHRVGSGGVRPVPCDGHDGGEPTMTAWLQDKLVGALTDVTCISHVRNVLGVDRSGRRTRETVRVVQVDTVDGVACVKEPTRLAALMAEGVGRAKSYGCGLLTIKSLR